MSTQRDSLDVLEDKIEYGFRFVTIISEGVLMIGLGYAGFKLAHRGATPATLDEIWLVSQVLALDLSAPGLFAMATRARDQGNERRAKWAIRIAIVLIVMSILTMAEGAITSYLPNIPQTIVLYVTVFMMVIRGCASVGYSVFRRLHKAANSPVIVAPESVVEESPFVAQLETLQQQMLHVTAHMEAVKVAPVVSQSVDVEAETEEPFIDDITAYRMRQEKAVDASTETSTEPHAKITRKLSMPMSAKTSTASGRESARTKALRILKKHPNIGPTELAQKASITRQYASQIMKQQSV